MIKFISIFFLPESLYRLTKK